jgi:hypothetical protein
LSAVQYIGNHEAAITWPEFLGSCLFVDEIVNLLERHRA